MIHKKETIHKLYREVQGRMSVTICNRVVPREHATLHNSDVTCKKCKASNLFNPYGRTIRPY